VGGGLCKEDAEAVECLQSYHRENPDGDGSFPSLEEIMAWVDEDDPPDQRVQDHLRRAIARNRLVMRNIKRLAEETEDPLEYAGLLQKYALCCSRLCRLLRQARPEPGRIAAWNERQLQDWARRQLEWWRQQPPIMVEGWTGPIPGPGADP
jgi:hypothetical protein